ALPISHPHDGRWRAPATTESRQAERPATPPWEAPFRGTTGRARSPAAVRTTSRPLRKASHAERSESAGERESAGEPGAHSSTRRTGDPPKRERGTHGDRGG